MLRIGLLGASTISPESIISPARHIKGVNVRAIAARNEERAKEFARKHNIEKVFSSYDDLVSFSGIDLVYNALPISLHAEWTIKAAKAGKHVLCEKPFAMNLDEAKAMNLAGTENGVRVIEGLHYRYHPAFAHCLEWIWNKEIGEIRHIEACFNICLLYTSPSPRDQRGSRMPSSA